MLGRTSWAVCTGRVDEALAQVNVLQIPQTTSPKAAATDTGRLKGRLLFMDSPPIA